MSKLKNHHSLLFVLAIVGGFSTVGAERVSANDIPVITNFVSVSETTGGVSKKGADGADGKPGEDGKPGADGASVYNPERIQSAAVETTIATEPVETGKVQTSELQPSELPAVFATETATSTQPELYREIGDERSEHSSRRIIFTLQDAVLLWPLMLVTYVTQLF